MLLMVRLVTFSYKILLNILKIQRERILKILSLFLFSLIASFRSFIAVDFYFASNIIISFERVTNSCISAGLNGRFARTAKS